MVPEINVKGLKLEVVLKYIGLGVGALVLEAQLDDPYNIAPTFATKPLN